MTPGDQIGAELVLDVSKRHQRVFLTYYLWLLAKGLWLLAKGLSHYLQRVCVRFPECPVLEDKNR